MRDSNTEVHLWPWFPFHHCLALMLVTLSTAAQPQPSCPRTCWRIAWPTWLMILRQYQKNVKCQWWSNAQFLSSTQKTPPGFPPLSGLTWTLWPIAQGLNSRWNGTKPFCPSLANSNINGKNNDEISAMLSFDGGSHCSVHTNVGSIIYYNDSRASLGKFVQGFLYNFNKWLEFSIPKWFNLTSFSQIGGQLWFSTEPFIQFFNFSLFFFERYFGACCRPDDWIRNWILQIWM